MQRSRLLMAAVGALEELGYEHTTVAQITSRARISRRTFYELFTNCEECLAAIFDDAVTQVEAELRAAGLAGLAWRERMRRGLWTILCCMEREPALARLVVVHALRSGGMVRERRTELVARLVAVVDEGRGERGGVRCGALTAEGVLGGTLAILHTRLADKEGEPLAGLLGELMSVIVLPYQGAAAARREQTRPAPVPVEPVCASRDVLAGRQDPLVALPMRLTYRTVRVLEGIGAHPGASNRQVAEYAGVGDQGQISKLLSRLVRLELIANRGAGHSKGEPNAWLLTPTGALVVRTLGAHLGTATRERAA